MEDIQAANLLDCIILGHSQFLRCGPASLVQPGHQRVRAALGALGTGTPIVGVTLNNRGPYICSGSIPMPSPPLVPWRAPGHQRVPRLYRVVELYLEAVAGSGQPMAQPPRLLALPRGVTQSAFEIGTLAP